MDANDTFSFRRVRIMLLGLWVEMIIAATCLAVVVEGAQMPDSKYDIVGAARLPMTVAIAILLLIVFRAVAEYRSAGTEQGESQGDFVWPVIPTAFVATIFAYVALLAYEVLPFFALTGVFTMVVVQLIAHRLSWRLSGVSLAIGLAFGYGVQVIFTKFLVLDLPT